MKDIRWAENFLVENYNVSRETLEMLGEFCSEVVRWNKAVHLVSSGEVESIWRRHVLDCFQLVPIINSRKPEVVVDFGSGSGFPGIVVAIACEFDSLNLLESNSKKAFFLEEVARNINKKIIVHNDRIENISNLKADIIMARAFSDINNLCYYATMHMHENTEIYTFKGKKFVTEFEFAKKNWDFTHKNLASNILNDSIITQITNLRAKR